jgi:hypothetical protein
MIDRKAFTRMGMNTDDVSDLVPDGDCYVMHNARSTKDKDGRGGAMKPLQSSQQRTSDATTGTKEVIGSYTDEVNGRVFYFKWNSNNTHRIWCWNRRTNTNLVVLEQANVTGGLGFGQFNYITGVAMIGDYLYWCNGNINEPRRINVERALRMNNPTYISPDGSIPDPYVSPLNQWDISVARRVPMYPLKWEKLISSEEADVPDQPVNHLDKNGIQFAMRYIYKSDEYSTVNGYSKIAPHNSTRSFVKEFDTIRVVMDKDERIEAEVKTIEFLARRDNIGSWYIIKSFTREDDEQLFIDHNTIGEPELSFLFYNKDEGIPLADSEAYVPFYDIPLFSNALEIADNRLFLFNNVKGYDHYDGPEITLSTELITAPTTDNWDIYGEYFLLEWSCGTGISEVVVLRIKETYGPLAGWYSTLFTAAQFNSNSLSTNLNVDQADKYPIVDFDDPPRELFEYLNPTCLTYTITAYAGTQPVLGNVGSFPESARAFRQGETYKVGVVFFDIAHRHVGVGHAVEEITIPAPRIYETEYVSEIKWELENIPGVIPLWAHSYSVCRSRVNESFIATYSPEVRYGILLEDGSYDWQVYGPHLPEYDVIGLNISRTVRGRRAGYTFSEGDFAKLVNSSGETFNVKIVGTFGEWVLLSPNDIGDTLGNFYIELITPRLEEKTYWEIGESYKVNNPGTATRSLSQTSGSMYGDTFFVTLGYVGTLPFPVLNYFSMVIPAMNPNDNFWEIWPQDYGRSYLLLNTKQQRYETDLHPSGAYFPGTETNQLNAFLAGENQQLDLAIGAGQILSLAARTQEYGTVLLAIGSTEVASIYVGRTEFYNADETPNVIRTTDVIGNVNILKGGFGTLNPESYVRNDGNGYWFSAIKGAWVRYAKDGVNAISERKFSVLASWLGNLVMTTASDIPGQSGIKVIGGFDDFNKEALWTIPPIGTWPIAYSTHDVEEDVNTTESPVGSVTFSTQVGEIYRFTLAVPSPVAMSITVIDLFFGSKTFTTTSATGSFLFVAATTGALTVTVTTTPAIGTLSRTYTVKKLRPNPYNVVNLVPKTVAFSEEENRWSYTWGVVSEWWGKIGDRLISFKAGNLHTHDASTVGSWHGITHPAWVVLIFNKPPNEVKRLQSFSMESDVEPGYVHFRTEEPYVQSTDLISSQIETREGIHSAGIMRDRLSPNTAGTVFDRMANGDPMRGRVIKALFEWPKLTKFVAKLINLKFRDSSGHKI